MNKIAEKISALRKAKGFGQKEFAQKIGVSHPSLGKFEKGETEIIPLGVAKKMAEELKISFTDLFDIDNTPQQQQFKKEINEGIAEKEKIRKQVNELKEQINLLKNYLEDKDQIIGMLKNEKVRIKNDIFTYLDDFQEEAVFYLTKLKYTIGLTDQQIKELTKNVINIMTSYSASYFLNRGLIDKEDYDKIPGKYVGIVRPGDRTE
jgi:transcriptional regulator with XRE-family HTH domain